MSLNQCTQGLPGDHNPGIYVITSPPSTSFDECYFISFALILAWVILHYNYVCFQIIVLLARSPIPLTSYFSMLLKKHMLTDPIILEIIISQNQNN